METGTRNISDCPSAKLIREFSGANLGDARLQRRLVSIVQRVSAKPAESFPLIFSEEAEREAFYRFLRNPSVHWENILEPHHQETRARVCEKAEIIAIHDSSPLQFRRKNKDGDLGIIGSNKRRNVQDVGFLGHFTLAVSTGLNPEPLGVVNVKTIRRKTKTKTKKRFKRPRKYEDRAKLESHKWIEGIMETRRKLGDCAQIIHVMDREADFFTLMGDLVKASERFVIRSAHERAVQNGDEILRISQVLAKSPVVCEREVHISERPQARGTASRKRLPARDSRKTLLSITATPIQIRRSEWAPLDHPKTLALNVVHITELNPPEGERPVDWKLFTTEAIDTEEQILKIVDIYRTRWLIEEFFKALKTGCSYEDRQLESFKTVMNALAILLPIAWQMLLLRHHSRRESSATSSPILNPLQLAIIISLSKGKLNGLSSSKSLLYAVAGLGGHIKNNGDPGWLVLYRGFRELSTLERGVNLNLGALQHVINP